MDWLLPLVAVVFVLAVFVAAVRAIVRWRGARRFLAVLSLLGAIGWGIVIVIGIQRDPTSHNLWPIEAVMVAGATLTPLVTIGVVRTRRDRSHQRRTSSAHTQKRASGLARTLPQ